MADLVPDVANLADVGANLALMTQLRQALSKFHPPASRTNGANFPFFIYQFDLLLFKELYYNFPGLEKLVTAYCERKVSKNYPSSKDKFKVVVFPFGYNDDGNRPFDAYVKKAINPRCPFFQFGETTTNNFVDAAKVFLSAPFMEYVDEGEPIDDTMPVNSSVVASISTASSIWVYGPYRPPVEDQALAKRKKPSTKGSCIFRIVAGATFRVTKEGSFINYIHSLTHPGSINFNAGPMYSLDNMNLSNDILQDPKSRFVYGSRLGLVLIAFIQQAYLSDSPYDQALAKRVFLQANFTSYAFSRYCEYGFVYATEKLHLYKPSKKIPEEEWRRRSTYPQCTKFDDEVPAAIVACGGEASIHYDGKTTHLRLLVLREDVATGYPPTEVFWEDRELYSDQLVRQTIMSLPFPPPVSAYAWNTSPAGIATPIQKLRNRLDSMERVDKAKLDELQDPKVSKFLAADDIIVLPCDNEGLSKLQHVVDKESVFLNDKQMLYVLPEINFDYLLSEIGATEKAPATVQEQMQEDLFFRIVLATFYGEFGTNHRFQNGEIRMAMAGVIRRAAKIRSNHPIFHEWLKYAKAVSDAGDTGRDEVIRRHSWTMRTRSAAVNDEEDVRELVTERIYDDWVPLLKRKSSFIPQVYRDYFWSCVGHDGFRLKNRAISVGFCVGTTKIRSTVPASKAYVAFSPELRTRYPCPTDVYYVGIQYDTGRLIHAGINILKSAVRGTGDNSGSTSSDDPIGSDSDDEYISENEDDKKLPARAEPEIEDPGEKDVPSPSRRPRKYYHRSIHDDDDVVENARVPPAVAAQANVNDAAIHPPAVEAHAGTSNLQMIDANEPPIDEAIAGNQDVTGNEREEDLDEDDALVVQAEEEEDSHGDLDDTSTASENSSDDVSSQRPTHHNELLAAKNIRRPERPDTSDEEEESHRDGRRSSPRKEKKPPDRFQFQVHQSMPSSSNKRKASSSQDKSPGRPRGKVFRREQAEQEDVVNAPVPRQPRNAHAPAKAPRDRGTRHTSRRGGNVRRRRVAGDENAEAAGANDAVGNEAANAGPALPVMKEFWPWDSDDDPDDYFEGFEEGQRVQTVQTLDNELHLHDAPIAVWRRLEKQFCRQLDQRDYWGRVHTFRNDTDPRARRYYSAQRKGIRAHDDDGETVADVSIKDLLGNEVDTHDLVWFSFIQDVNYVRNDKETLRKIRKKRKTEERIQLQRDWDEVYGLSAFVGKKSLSDKQAYLISEQMIVEIWPDVEDWLPGTCRANPFIWLNRNNRTLLDNEKLTKVIYSTTYDKTKGTWLARTNNRNRREFPVDIKWLINNVLPERTLRDFRQNRMNEWIDIPVSDANVHDKDPTVLHPHATPIAYPQGELEGCLLHSFASCLHDIPNFFDASQKLMLNSSKVLFADKRFGAFVDLVNSVCKGYQLKKIPPFLGRIGVDTNFSVPHVMVLQADDGQKTHAVTAYLDKIYDSSWHQTLPICQETLDWCCCNTPFKRIAKVYILAPIPGYKTRKKATKGK